MPSADQIIDQPAEKPCPETEQEDRLQECRRFRTLCRMALQLNSRALRTLKGDHRDHVSQRDKALVRTASYGVVRDAVPVDQRLASSKEARQIIEGKFTTTLLHIAKLAYDDEIALEQGRMPRYKEHISHYTSGKGWATVKSYGKLAIAAQDWVEGGCKPEDLRRIYNRAQQGLL